MESRRGRKRRERGEKNGERERQKDRKYNFCITEME